MIALEMQSIRRNDAVQVLQRRCYNKVGLPLEEGLPKSCDALFSLAELESVIPLVRSSVPPTPQYAWPLLKALGKATADAMRANSNWGQLLNSLAYFSPSICK